MKKSLLALAALSAIAGTAQAQSSVTLFGALDAGAYGVNQTQNTTTGSAAWGVLANTIVSSNWGLKGTEDLGGGLKANFYAEAGINPRNGALSQTAGENGVTSGGIASTLLFDRGLYVGVQGNWGRLDLGNKLSPFYASHGGILPVSGNSVAVNAAAAQGYNLPFVHNSISYTLPTLGGFNAAIQYGAGNAINDSSAGSVINGAIDYTVGGLNLRAAGQYLAKNGTPLSANNINTTYANGVVTNKSPSVGTYLIGAKYNMGAFTVGAGWVSNVVGGYTNTNSLATTPNGYTVNNYQLGVGYQATPAVLLGFNWIGSTSGSNLLNAQARYAFSKRTQAYAQLGYALNTAGLGANQLNIGNFAALSGSSGSNIGGGVTLAQPTFNQFAGGVGLIHTF